MKKLAVCRFFALALYLSVQNSYAVFVGFSSVEGTVGLNKNILTLAEQLNGIKGVQENTTLSYEVDKAKGVMVPKDLKLSDEKLTNKVSSGGSGGGNSENLLSPSQASSSGGENAAGGNPADVNSALKFLKGTASVGEKPSSETVPPKDALSPDSAIPASSFLGLSGNNPLGTSSQSSQGENYAALVSKGLEDSQKTNSGQTNSGELNKISGVKLPIAASNANSGQTNSGQGSDTSGNSDSGYYDLNNEGFYGAFPSGAVTVSQNSVATAGSGLTGNNSSPQHNQSQSPSDPPKNSNPTPSTMSPPNTGNAASSVKIDGCFTAKNDFYSKLGNTGSYTHSVPSNNGKKKYCIEPGAQNLDIYRKQVNELVEKCSSEISMDEEIKNIPEDPSKDQVCVLVEDPPKGKVDHNIDDLLDSSTHEKGNVPLGWPSPSSHK